MQGSQCFKSETIDRNQGPGQRPPTHSEGSPRGTERGHRESVLAYHTPAIPTNQPRL